MIRIFLGNLGSGKSANAVRELYLDESDRITYTNLLTKDLNHVVHIKPEFIIRKIISDKKKVTLDLNIDYWKKQKKPLNILWDEIQLTANSRMSMTKVNMVMSRFISMARRITGFDERGYGHFTFVAQKERTIDVNIKDLTNEIIYHISHWILRCEDCNVRFEVNSEMQQFDKCVICGSWKILKSDLKIEVIKFNDWEKYYKWCLGGKGKLYFDRILITDIDKYFKLYDTMQMSDIWDNYINLNP